MRSDHRGWLQAEAGGLSETAHGERTARDGAHAARPPTSERAAGCWLRALAVCRRPSLLDDDSPLKREKIHMDAIAATYATSSDDEHHEDDEPSTTGATRQQRDHQQSTLPNGKVRQYVQATSLRRALTFPPVPVPVPVPLTRAPRFARCPGLNTSTGSSPRRSSSPFLLPTPSPHSWRRPTHPRRR